MSGTFEKIDYRLRPNKHVERTMLVDLMRQLRFAPIEHYQYVGFGSVAFVDFRMMHRQLGIDKLISIEDVSAEGDKVRFRRNKPLACIDLKFGKSNVVLPTLSFSSPSAVWLDYDGALSRSMANDLATIAQDAGSGTFVAVTLTLTFAKEATETTPEYVRITEEFEDYVDDETKPLTFINSDRHADFARNVLGDLLKRALNNADAGKPNKDLHRELHQVCNFRYSDGAAMMTLAWVIATRRDRDKYNACRFDALPFFTPSSEPFRIRTPLVTPFEIREMERRISNVTSPTQLKWLPMKERQRFARLHRYLPSYGNVEPV